MCAHANVFSVNMYVLHTTFFFINEQHNLEKRMFQFSLDFDGRDKIDKSYIIYL